MLISFVPRNKKLALKIIHVLHFALYLRMNVNKLTNGNIEICYFINNYASTLHKRQAIECSIPKDKYNY